MECTSELRYGVGVLAALFIVVQPLFHKELMPDEVLQKNLEKEVYILYLLMITLFAFMSSLGFSIADSLNKDLLPTKQGLIDGIWATLIMSIFIPLLKHFYKKISNE